MIPPRRGRSGAHQRPAPVACQAAQVAWADGVGAEIGEADLRKTNEIVGKLLRVLSDRRHLSKERPSADQLIHPRDNVIVGPAENDRGKH